MTPRTVSLPPDDALRAAAAALLETTGDASALSMQTVILPHRGIAPELARALHAAVGRACALPRLLTLSDWLALQPVAPATLARPQLVAELQRQLAARAWLAEADHWALASELAGLFEEMGRSLVAFPSSEAALADLLSRACEARASELLHFDAQLAYHLWMACEGHPEWGTSAWQRDAMAMTRLLEAPEGPLWVFDAGLANPQAVDLFRRYAALAPVTLLYLLAAVSPRAAWVDAALAEGTNDPLGERARQWGAAEPQPPAGVRIHKALGREGEAAHVCDTVCEWLAQGKAAGRTPRIAVVATDRVLARRLRALLERKGVLADDKAGWYLATTRVGAAVRDLLRLQRRPTAALLLACIDSPLVDAQTRATLRAALGPALAAVPTHALLDWLVVDAAAAAAAATSACDSPCAVSWLTRLKSALTTLGGRSRSLSDWIGALLEALEGLAPGLGLDPAGAQLIAHLQRSHAALARHGWPRPHTDFSDWLDWTLGETLFRDDPVESPVLLTHPAGLRGLSFDAIVVAGADAAHLPAPLPRLRVVRDAARAELGLPDVAARRARAVEDWCLLTGSAPQVEITLQELDDRGEPVAASPFVLMMQRFHQLAWGLPLPEALPFARVAPATPASLRPAERASAGPALPEALSPSGYQTLLDCPYRFFVREWLRLKPREDAVEGLEPRDYGDAVHAILKAFHQRVPTVQALAREAAADALDEVACAVFAPLLARDFGATAWLERWRQVAPAYLDWQLAREAAGWHVEVALCEQPVRDELSFAVAGQAASSIRLHGKPDRVDLRIQDASPALVGPVTIDPGVAMQAVPVGAPAASSASLAVIDYKTGARYKFEALEKDPSEDAQLVLYAHLVPAVDEVTYLPLGSDAPDKSGIKPVRLAGEALTDAVAGHLTRLAATLGRIAADEPLLAMGDARACQHCHAAGLCRREHRASPGTGSALDATA
jgi:ATP-dependent helicase/nuclease subunit B